ncbi:hypothetical protein ACFV9D_30820 [Streptomyces sp. NPDC059875]|uniref:hypothetical protein n=1 Tax=unclassified Streptomyces TaxID=2593676 RepID=UPI0036494E58
MTLKARIVAVLSALFAIAGFSLVSATAASAAGYGCSGSLIAQKSIRTSQNVQYGTLNVYYNSSTGMNCVAAVKNATGGAGIASETNVTIYRCVAGSAPGSSCYTDDSDTDGGSFSSYAGPAEVYAAGRCVRLYANIWHPTNGWIASYWGGNANKAEHCG